MLTKCANPACSAPFLYLHQGKLFRIEVEGVTGDDLSLTSDSNRDNPSRRIEYFWLCDDCSKVMTITFEKGAGVTMAPLRHTHKAAAS